MLIQTLTSISEQVYNLCEIEIIVVSQTETIKKQILLNANLSLNIFIRPEHETISALRNYGVTQATGQYLAFLDADIWLSKNWASQMIRELTSIPERIVTSAMQICDADALPLEKIRTSLSNAEIDTNVAFLPGRNLFMHKDSFVRIGGFPEHLITCEDYFFTDRAAKLGSLFYTSAATYIHLGEDKAYKAMYNKEIWRGQSNLQSISGRKIPLREWPSFVVPPAIMALLLMSLLLMISGASVLAVVTFLLAAFPVCLYSLRLYVLAEKKISLLYIIKFYVFYFPARAIGTVLGLFKSIGIKTDQG